MEPKLLIAHIASGNAIFTADVLQLGSELWIVPEWIESPDGRWRTPARAIRMDVLAHQRSGAHGADLTLNETLPRSVLDGHTSYAEGKQYQVIEGPSDHFGPIHWRKAT